MHWYLQNYMLLREEKTERRHKMRELFITLLIYWSSGAKAAYAGHS
jgi:hypothetical protein